MMRHIMIHRALPTRDGKVIRPGEYGCKLNSLAGYIAVYTLGSPNILLTSMTFDQFNKADLEGWLTEIKPPVSQPVDDNPFRGEVTIRVTPRGIAALDEHGQLKGSRVV